MKVCKICKQALPLDIFGKHPYSADGLEYSCKPCKNAKLRKYRKDNPQWTLDMRRKHYIRSCDNIRIRLKRVWTLMQKRCNDKNDYQYFRYGGRGIQIKWDSFDSFIKDMMPSYSPELTIERVNNNGNYSPDNCRWATHIEQSNNTRRNVFFDFEGERKTLAQIARESGMSYKLLWKRVHTYGWDLERALRQEIRK